MSTSVRSPALVSLVVPVYGVEVYLAEFLGSLDEQGPRDLAGRVEVVLVDDGSPDACAEMLDAWAETSAYPVQVVHQPNGGLAAARNAGLDLARGRFVSFPDPDDLLSPGYLDTVMTVLADLPDDVPLAAARILLLNPDGSISDTHPLSGKFVQGAVTVDLDVAPDNIQLQAASSFLRRDLLVATGLRFDGSVRPNFEDAFLIALLLRAAPTRMIALVPDAHYVYRRRDDGSSLVQQSWSKREKYVVLPRVGYLRLLETFAADGAGVPRWVQNLVLYDLLFYFREDERIHSATAGLDDEVRAGFHAVVSAIMAHLDVDAVEGFSVVSSAPVLRQALLIGYRGQPLRPDRVHVHRVDVRRQIAQVRYLYGGDAPQEQLHVDGVEAAPVHAKVRDLVYFGRVLAYERIFWVPATATLSLSLDGRSVPLELGPPSSPVFDLPPERLWKELGGGRRMPAMPAPEAGTPTRALTEVETLQAVLARRGSALRRSRVYRALRRRLRPSAPTGRTGHLQRQADDRLLARASSPEARGRFEDAWAFMDRDTMAQDNAEHLYRWVRQERPDINAWFVLRRDSADWDRLEREGFRLVDPRSDDHVLLMKNTEHRLSSQVDHYVVHPLDKDRFGAARGRFTFLQHGVTKDDLSRWINGKPISLLITATQDEHDGLAGDHSPYIFTTKEVALTGFPRHDRLLELARGAGPSRWLLVAPTWRRELFGAATLGNARELRADLTTSDYYRTWLAVLRSTRLTALARSWGLQVAFLPHPNLDGLFDAALPDDVVLLGYRGSDIQRTIVDTGLMVTDYSSLAFEQAYLEKPVVYHQTDVGSIFAGSHIGRRGAWSYESDGFGPVTSTVDELVEAVAACGAPDGLASPAPYADRMRQTFPFRDGSSCERVVARVEALLRPAEQSVAHLRPAQRGALVPTVQHEPGGWRWLRQPSASQVEATGK